MPKDQLVDYDSTAANNTDIGGISTDEGMLPSNVNDAFREQMSHLADFAAGTSGINVLSLTDDTDTNQIKIQAPASVTTTTTFTLPDGDGSSGQTLLTNGSGTLSWGSSGGSAEVWVQFNGSTNAIGGSLNVSSLTDHGTGDFTIAVTNAFSANDEFSATYGGNVRSGTAINYASGYDFNRLPTASNMRWAMENANGGAFDNSNYGNHLSVHGNLA